MKELQILSLFCSGFLIAAIPQADAATTCGVSGNLVSNCGFETGSFSGWTLSGADTPGQLNDLYGVEGKDPVDSIAPFSGSYQAFFADLSASPITISQSIATSAGSTYSISFYIAQDTNPASGGSSYTDSLAAKFGGSTLISSTVVPQEGYTKYTFTDVASGPVSVLSLTFGDDLGEFLLDDVTVAAPEPASWCLLAGGLAAAFFLRRRLAA